MPVDPDLVVYLGPGQEWHCDFGKKRRVIEFVPRRGGRDCDVRYYALPDGRKLHHEKEYQISLAMFAHQAIKPVKLRKKT